MKKNAQNDYEPTDDNEHTNNVIPVTADDMADDPLNAYANGEVEEDPVWEFQTEENTINEGTYLARIKDVLNEKAKSSGNPQIVIVMKLFGANKPQGRVYLSLSEKARWKLTKTIKACGIMPEGQQITVRKSQLIDRYVIIEVTHEEYQGEKRDRIEITREAVPDEIAAYADELS
jgi:hypothetical protein